MRLTNLTATAHPGGNRIDLAWTNPDPAAAPAIRVMRREGTWPSGPDDGTRVADAAGLSAYSDTGLRGETVYYYRLFPHAGTPPVYDTDPHHQIAATATAPYDFAGRLYGLLPALYRRYDAARNATPLRRFLDLPGAELDNLYSHTRMLLGLLDVDRVDAALLPLLGQWIGWRTDYRRTPAQQRSEIHFAPQVYRTIGGLDAVGATVARVTGWPSRTKEYVHNVARTNRPDRLILWSAVRDPAGTLSAPAPASLNFAYDGRPVLVRQADSSVLAIYHTERAHGWDIWAKRWTATGGWEPSAPVVDRAGLDKHPTATLAGGRLWLFWQAYDPAEKPGPAHWRIWFSVRTGTQWSAPQIFSDAATERQTPTAAADGSGGVWLFWRERTADGWRVRWNRHDGTNWQLATHATMPPDGTDAPRVDDDLIVVANPGAAGKPLWLFWTRQGPDGPPGQTRRSIAYRIKTDLDPAATAWSPVRTVPKTGAPPYHDRFPCPVVQSSGDIELLWSTTRGGGATVVHNVLAATPLTWGTTATLIPGPYANRAPAAAPTPAGGLLLLYRTNHSIEYDVGPRRTLDNRYAGTTTADTRDVAKLAGRDTYEDFQTYVHDAGALRVRTGEDRIARDTIGVFLDPDTTDPDELAAETARLAEALREFMPVTARAVFITP